jgi:hypothetical protein
MKRIREILLTQYIGAITVGFILAQATISFINELAGAVAEYWAIQQNRGSAIGAPTSFRWANFIVSMTSVALHLVVGFLLIRWLYAEDTTRSGDQEGESSGVELEP